MMVPLKRRKVVSSDGPQRVDNTRFPLQVIFILERRMGASRRAFLAQLGRRKGFRIQDTYSESVTHVISENNTGGEVRTWLGEGGGQPVGDQSGPPVHLLDISWYTESMQEGRPVAILDRHRLQEQQQNVEESVFSATSYACQRSTPQPGHNTHLTDSLAVLAESAELSGDEGRGLAFRRSEAVLRSLDRRVQRVADLRGLPCLGQHSRRVIQDVLENGSSREVQETQSAPRYRAMKVLTGIFGVGVKTANRWFTEGICSLAQLETSGHKLNPAQQAGLEFYADLNQPVTRDEADAISITVEDVVQSVLPGARVTLAGGFRRGKTSGHDVDFLITHPVEGEEEGLLCKVIACLESRGLLLYHQTTRNSYREAAQGPGRPSSSMDRFERCFSIFKLTNHSHPEDTKRQLQTQQTQQKDQGPARVQVEGDQDPARVEVEGDQDPARVEVEGDQDPARVEAEGDQHPARVEVEGDQDPARVQVEGDQDPARVEVEGDQDPARVEVEGDQDPARAQVASGSRPWRAVRVDLVVSPISQFAFALLGWTGSKLFEREMRRWAVHEKSMTLSSHALYDKNQRRHLRASSEREIFAHLGLEYVSPSGRNA